MAALAASPWIVRPRPGDDGPSRSVVPLPLGEDGVDAKCMRSPPMIEAEIRDLTPSGATVRVTSR